MTQDETVIIWADGGGGQCDFPDSTRALADICVLLAAQLAKQTKLNCSFQKLLQKAETFCKAIVYSHIMMSGGGRGRKEEHTLERGLIHVFI